MFYGLTEQDMRMADLQPEGMAPGHASLDASLGRCDCCWRWPQPSPRLGGPAPHQPACSATATRAPLHTFWTALCHAGCRCLEFMSENGGLLALGAAGLPAPRLQHALSLLDEQPAEGPQTSSSTTSQDTDLHLPGVGEGLGAPAWAHAEEDEVMFTAAGAAFGQLRVSGLEPEECQGEGLVAAPRAGGEELMLLQQTWLPAVAGTPAAAAAAAAPASRAYSGLLIHDARLKSEWDDGFPAAAQQLPQAGGRLRAAAPGAAASGEAQQPPAKRQQQGAAPAATAPASGPAPHFARSPAQRLSAAYLAAAGRLLSQWSSVPRPEAEGERSAKQRRMADVPASRPACHNAPPLAPPAHA